jgi:hypothetical protein
MCTRIKWGVKKIKNSPSYIFEKQRYSRRALLLLLPTGLFRSPLLLVFTTTSRQQQLSISSYQVTNSFPRERDPFKRVNIREI